MKPPGKLALIKDSWSISAIVLWEISELSELGAAKSIWNIRACANSGENSDGVTHT